MSAVILNLLVDEGIFSSVSDSLLVFQGEQIEFTTLGVRSYSNQHALESISEQVSGYLGKVQIQIRTSEASYLSIVEFLKNQHPNMQCRYWVVPVLDSGSFL